MKIRKLASIAAALAAVSGLAACGGGSGAITVVTREEGSGTRSAFVELFGVHDADANDIIAATAEQTNSTSVMIESVKSGANTIGYISLGTLNSDVKALAIDGVAATTDNVKNGSYAIKRPFLIASKGELSPAARDFVSYINSADGQSVIETNGYISVGNAGAYSGSGSGKIVVAGSSSVSPLMEKLKEAYIAVNPGADIEIQTHDSSTGMNNTIDGICDIGMASRELKESEIEKGLSAERIAIDGIAVIVNNGNAVSGLTKDQVKEIFLGDITEWAEVK
ncbi:MAG: substrate-binding domain-containing protein [Clostridiales bacterium]|jgi:phosphate transport system substrate-binding protein|nr:substrate-binding domain-containing protein [Clostridiales bacterium]